MNPLQQLQDDTVTLLLGNPATASVPFSSFRRQAIESLQDESQAGWKVRVPGQVGVNCLVLMPEVTAKYQNVPGPQYELEITIRTFEDPRVNNIGLSAEDVALSNLRWLDGLIIEDLTAFYARTQGPALSPNYDYPGFLVYDSVLMGQLPQDLVTRTPAPQFSDDNAGTVQLACSDPAGLLYYTLDGTMPQPGGAPAPAEGTDPSTILYSGPFVVPAGTVVRCVAWNPALLPSDIAKGTINY